jgi:D-amino-acid dehydrogenase
MTTAIVIGGGVIGSAAALQLQRRGIATRIVDPDPDWRGASRGNAGLIAIDEVDPLASRATLRRLPAMLFSRGGPVGLPLRDIAAWLPFGLRLVAASNPARFAAGRAALASLLGQAVPAWRRLAADLGAPDLLHDEGHFVVWSRPGDADARAAHDAPNGITTARDATDEELARLGTLMKPPAAACFVEGTARIADIDLLARALADRFIALGGARLRGRARIEGQGVRLDTGERLEADTILVAAGPASGGLLRPLGHKAPIIAERGYHIQCAGTGWPEDMPTIFVEDRSMMLTRFRSGLRATSFVEFGRASSPPDPRKWRRLRAHVRDLGLPFDDPVAEWMGARPTLPDYLPAIGRSTRHPKIFYAFGHHHLGMTLAAITGEMVEALVVGEAPAIGLAPFAVDRFE